MSRRPERPGVPDGPEDLGRRRQQMDNDIDLTGDDVEVETLADGSALGCFACATSGSTA